MNGFQISHRLQELMVYAGQLDSYQKSNEIPEEFLTIKVSCAQVYRVTDSYGKQVGETAITERTLLPVKQQEVLYVEADGSMIFTRDEGWKEVKAGRLFKSRGCLHAEGKPGCIRYPQYSAHLGRSKEFTGQMDQVIESYGSLANRLAFISDGTPWIKNRVEDAFSRAVSILDYYHAVEHLYRFTDNYFKDKSEGKQWTKSRINYCCKVRYG